MSELAIHYARNAPEQAARPVNKLLQYISHIFTCVSLLTGLVWPLLHRLPSISQFRGYRENGKFHQKVPGILGLVTFNPSHQQHYDSQPLGRSCSLIGFFMNGHSSNRNTSPKFVHERIIIKNATSGY
jgi:hypothetical protein